MSCCVRVGSGVQTDATTPSKVGTCSVSWERYVPYDLGDHVYMGVCGPNDVGRAVQTDPTLLRHSSAITEQKKYWELLAQKVNRFQNLRNNS